MNNTVYMNIKDIPFPTRATAEAAFVVCAWLDIILFGESKLGSFQIGYGVVKSHGFAGSGEVGRRRLCLI